MTTTGEPPEVVAAKLEEITWVRAAVAAPAPVVATDSVLATDASAGDGDVVSAARTAEDGAREFESPPPAVTAEPHDQWREQVDAAKVTWDRLSMAELVDSRGIEHRLITLVQSCYGISLRDATRRVKTFFHEQES